MTCTCVCNALSLLCVYTTPISKSRCLNALYITCTHYTHAVAAKASGEVLSQVWPGGRAVPTSSHLKAICEKEPVHTPPL